MSGAARIVEQGYRPYDGPRQGRSAAMRTVVAQSIARVLGIRRGVGAKLLPALIILISFLPAVTFVGMAALLPRQLVTEGILPSYGEYYGYITSAIVIFAAFIAPELLCTDRRTRMLGLLLASPLDRTTYLASKAIAVVVTLSVITIGPPLLMLVAFTLENAGPASFSEWMAMFGRILLAGSVIAGVHTSLSLAVASFTDRHAFASAGVLLILLLSATVTSTLINAADASVTLELFNLLGLPFELVTRIYPDVSAGQPALSTALVATANLGWFAVFSLLVVVRYRRLAVTR